MLKLGGGIVVALALLQATGVVAQTCTAKPGLGHAKLGVEMDKVMTELGPPSSAEKSSKAPFVALPTDDIMNGFYPPDMKAQNVSAVVGVACQFDENGVATMCKTRGAYPAGCGFEEATIAAAQQHIRVDVTDVKLHTPGGWRYLQYYWNAPGADGASFIQYITGKWEYPTATEFLRLIPEATQRQKVEGWAKVDCAIDPTGSVYECRVIDEEPKGYIYGLAVASAFIKFASVAPQSVPGGIPAGARRKFTYKVSY